MRPPGRPSPLPGWGSSRAVAVLVALTVGALPAGCADGPPSTAPSEAPSEAPSTAPSEAPTEARTEAPTRADGGPAVRPTPTPPDPDRFDTWQVGATPLPLRADGFGEVRPTPPRLRVRRLRTAEVLPPPADGAFHAGTVPMTPRLRRRTDLAWAPGCPVPLRDLRLLTLSFWGFDDLPHTGRLVVHASVADDVVSVFATLFERRFPLEEMRVVTRQDLDAAPTGDGNTTAGYACRPAVGTSTFSSHARGLAVDVNPFMNPYMRGDLVLPELATAYTDRSRRLPGMIRPDGVVVRAFARVGWTWGGTFSSVTDLHHFSADGR